MIEMVNDTFLQQHDEEITWRESENIIEFVKIVDENVVDKVSYNIINAV